MTVKPIEECLVCGEKHQIGLPCPTMKLKGETQRKSLLVSELTDEQFLAIMNARPPEEK